MRTAQESQRATERLAQLHRRATRYEIAAEFGGQSYLLAYRRLRSSGELLDCWRAVPLEVRDRIVAQLGITVDTPAAYSAACGWNFGGLLAIRRTGRTEREALVEGELAAVLSWPVLS